MKKLIIGSVTALVLMAGGLVAGAAHPAAATGPDSRACDTPAAGHLQAAFGATDPCVVR